MKRVLHRKLVIPIANLLASTQLITGDFLTVDGDESHQNLTFYKHQKPTQTGLLQDMSGVSWLQTEVTSTNENTAAAA